MRNKMYLEFTNRACLNRRGCPWAAAGLMFAPKAGRESRKDIKQYANKVRKESRRRRTANEAGFEVAFDKGRALLESTAA